MTPRRADLLRAAASLAGLAVVVLGVPLALVTMVGWPLPRTIPTWDAISRALETGEVADGVWLKGIACVVWAAWAQFTASVVVEVRAAVRGKVARQLPGVPSSAQFAAARLVTTVAVVLASFGGRPAAAAPPVFPAFHVVTPPASTAPFAPEPEPAVVEAAAPAADEKNWTVQRRDSLWSIAERTLGSGERCGELFELNRGRPQPDGRSLTRPDVVRPGWVLKLPSDATVRPAGETGARTVLPGDSLWEIAEQELGSGERSVELFELNRGRPQADGGTLTDPNLIRPGWVLRVGEPPAVATPPTASAPGPSPTAPPPADLSPPRADTPPDASAPASVGDSRSDASHPPHGADSRGSEGVNSPPATTSYDDDLAVGSVVAGALTLGGVAIAIDRLRRVQQRRRRPGRCIAVPDAESDAEKQETRLRSLASGDSAIAVNAALRRLTSQQLASGTAASLLTVVAWGRSVTLRIDGDDEAPEGFVPREDGWCFELDESREIAGTPSAAPALVPVGADERGEVLIDIEAAGVLAVAGDDASGLLAALATSLATAPWSDDAEVVLVGVEAEIPLPWVRRLASIDEALDEAERRTAEVAAALQYAGVRTSMAGRMAGVTTEAWEPLVVVCDADLSEEQAVRVARLSQRGNCGVAVVVRGDLVGVEWQAHVVEGRFRLPILDLDVEATSADAAMVATAGELLTLACAEDRPPRAMPVIAESSAEPADDEPARRRQGDDDPEEAEHATDVEVRVLGEVEIVRVGGDPVIFERSKSAEAVAYLTFHPAGVTKDPLQYALWPDGANAEGTWHHTISKARRALGDGGDGAPLFPPVSSTGGIYRLSPRVGSDYHRFCALLAEAEGSPDELARKLLSSALKLVRGEPLMARGVGYGWRAGLAATIEGKVVDAAERMGELCLRAGDARRCEWAARRGLLVSPYDERLYRLLMRAADAAGNSAGVQKVLNELAAKLELDVEPLDGVHPETVKLFEELTARQGRVSA